MNILPPYSDFKTCIQSLMSKISNYILIIFRAKIYEVFFFLEEHWQEINNQNQHYVFHYFY